MGVILVLAVVVLLAGLPYWYGPIRVHGTQRPPLEPKIRLAETAPPADVAAFIAEHTLALAALGFTPVADLELLEGVPMRVALLEQAAAQELALVLSVVSPGGARRWHVQFASGFTDGRNVTTTASGHAGVFGLVPSNIVTRVPGVTDVALLHRIHRRQVAQQAPGERKRWCPITDPVLLMRESHQREMRGQVAIGYFRVAGEVYRPTWKGACLMTWRLLPPWKTRLAAARDREQERLIAEAERQP